MDKKKKAWCDKLIENGHVLRLRKTESYQGNGTLIKTKDKLLKYIAEVPESEREGIHVVMDLKGNKKLIAIDFDDCRLWECIKGCVKAGLLGKAIINPTKRGGHLLYMAKGDVRKKVAATLRLGVKADILPNEVSILNKWKHSEGEASQYDLEVSELPYLLQKVEGKHGLETAMPEGKRNMDIYRVVKQSAREDRSVMVPILGTYFCDPPLDAEEIDNLTASVLKPDTKDLGHGENMGNVILSDDLQYDLDLLFSHLQKKLRYDSTCDTWFSFKDTHWVELRGNEALNSVESTILKNGGQYRVVLKYGNITSFSRDMLRRLTKDLALPASWRKVAAGMNFTNGFLSFDTMELSPHAPERFITAVVDLVYDPSKYPGKELKDKLSELMGGNIHRLNLLRSLICRCCLPCPKLNTVYMITGPPGTGKSVAVALLMHVLGPLAKAVTLSDMQNHFTRAEYRDKNLLVASEVLKLTPEDCTIIKAYSGGDFITAGIKNSQGVIMYQHNGTMLFVSNKTLEDLVQGDGAMTDRMLKVEFDHIPETPDPGLIDYLKAHTNDILNWGLTLRRDRLDELVRAGKFNKQMVTEESKVAKFLNEHCFKDPKGAVSRKELYQTYKGFCETEELEIEHSNSAFEREVLSTCRRVFKVQVGSGRKMEKTLGKRAECYTGLSMRVANETTLESLVEPEYLLYDPWEVDPPLKKGSEFTAKDNGKGQYPPSESKGSDTILDPLQDIEDPITGQDTQKEEVVRHDSIVNVCSDLQDTNSYNEPPVKALPAADACFKDEASLHQKEAGVRLPMKTMELEGIGAITHEGAMHGVPRTGYGFDFSHSLDNRKREMREHYPQLVVNEAPSPLLSEIVHTMRKFEDCKANKHVRPPGKVGDLKDVSAGHAQQAFDHAYNWFLEDIASRLSETRILFYDKYHPRKLHQLWKQSYQRVELSKRLGEVAYIFELQLQDQQERWDEALLKTRLANPLVKADVIKGTQSKNVNIHQNKKGGGYFFPHAYQMNKGLRLSPMPPHTVRDAARPFRAALVRSITACTGFFMLDIDLSACHTRVAASIVNPNKAYYLNKANNEADLWLDMAKEFQSNHPMFANWDIKLLRKCIKVHCLAVLNGGGTGNPAHIGHGSGILGPSCGYKVGDIFLHDQVGELAKAFEKLPIVKEFRDHHVTIAANKSYFVPFLLEPQTVETKHKSASKVFCSFETLIMTYLIEYIAYSKIKILPLASVHDGIMAISQHDLSSNDILAFQDGFKAFLDNCIGVRMPVEVEKL